MPEIFVDHSSWLTAELPPVAWLTDVCCGAMMFMAVLPLLVLITLLAKVMVPVSELAVIPVKKLPSP